MLLMHPLNLVHRFAATVRLLLANVSIHLNNPYVTVSILSGKLHFKREYDFCIDKILTFHYCVINGWPEAQAQAQQQNHSSPLAEASGEILNSTGNLELQQATRHLTCNLRNMQLKKIKRAEKKGTESVMDEKFALLFQSKFQTGDMQLNVMTHTLSHLYRFDSWKYSLQIFLIVFISKYY